MSPDRWNAIQDVFDRVAELSPPEREIVLRGSCPDEEIASEVRRLLDQLERAGSFLEFPPQAARALRTEPESEALRLQPGMKVAGRFEIIRLLGRGGMGEVYEAHDHSSGESVALKTLRASLIANRKALHRFRLELLRARRVTHRNVCRLHEIHFVEDENGVPLVFLTMELLIGRTLQTVLRQPAGIAQEDAVGWIDGIASGLDAAHAAGVVHRDLKPGNIMVIGGGPSARVVITDFGLALSTLDSTHTEMSGDRALIGTPAYMAPEQLRGEPATPASDIYSFGVVVCEMLYGKKPDEALLVSGDRQNRQWTSALHRCLSADPTKRFPSAAEFVTVLQESPPRRSISRRLVLGGVAAAAAGGILWWGRPGRHATVALAVLPVDSGPDDKTYIGSAATELLIQSLRRSGRFEVPGPDTVGQYRNKSLPVTSIARSLKVDWLLASSLQSVDGKVHIQARLIRASGSPGPQLRQFEGSLGQLDQITRTIARDVAGALGPALAQADSIDSVGSSSPVAYDLYLRGRYFWNRRQRDDLVEARRLFEQCISLDPSFAPGYCGHADTLCTLADYSQVPPAEVLPIAKQSAITALGLKSNLADCHVSFGTATCFNDFDWFTAERSYQRALELNPDHGQAHRSYSTLLMKMQRTEECIHHAQEAIRLDALSMPNNRNLASMLYFLRRYPEAIDQINKIKTMSPGFFSTGELLAESYARLRRTAAAMENIAALKTDTRTPGFSLAYVATTYAILGMRADAVTAIQNLISRNLPFQPVHVARVWAELGNEAECLRWLEVANSGRDTGLQILPVHQSFDPIRATESFQQFVTRLRIIYPPKR